MRYDTMFGARGFTCFPSLPPSILSLLFFPAPLPFPPAAGPAPFLHSISLSLSLFLSLSQLIDFTHTERDHTHPSDAIKVPGFKLVRN